MIKHKIKPHVLSVSGSPVHNNFLTSLLSGQRLLAILCLAFLVLITFPLAKTYTQRKLMDKEIAEIKAEIATYEKNHEELKEMIAYLESDQSLEEQARLSLNLKKPGEQVIVIDYSKQNLTPVSSSSEQRLESNFVKWWRYFFIDN